MLVLTRKSGESIMIGEEIVVTVIAVEGEAVRIGINAPREVPVFRSEIYDEIRRENLRALRSAARLQENLGEALPGRTNPPGANRQGGGTEEPKT